MMAVLVLSLLAYYAAATTGTTTTTATGDDCAPLSLTVGFWSGESVLNTVDGKLKLAFDDASGKAEHVFATLFEEPQDLTQHSLVSFNLYKVREPVSLYLSVVTPYGEHVTEAVALFEQKNTITVDLSTNEFSIDGSAYNQPIVGLSSVSEIRLYLVASQLSAAGEAIVDSMLVCAAATATGSSGAIDENLRIFDLINKQPTDAAAADALSKVAFPDVESLSAALISALNEVQQLTTEVAELRATQRRALRAFEQFSENARSSLDTAIDALSGSMSANADQTLANAKLLERFRTSLSDSLSSHASRLAQLEVKLILLLIIINIGFCFKKHRLGSIRCTSVVGWRSFG